MDKDGIKGDLLEEIKSLYSKEFFKTLFEHAPDSYYISDLEGTFINPLGQKTMGLPMDEWEGGDMLQCSHGDKTLRTQCISYRVSYRLDTQISPPYPKSWITWIPEKTFS